MDERKWYTARQMARLLNCSEQTIYRLGYRGELETKKIGGMRRFRLPEETTE